ncbi:MAG TPA: acyl-CoA dehydrogenase family protein [Caulobacteraceae bacterium]|jgi:alkylation response protein AidB-like acyl-CoA dehydrogenase|nr:acyl-CoA dehydrogenase family protein [Caulobacteraceae bacterium]
MADFGGADVTTFRDEARAWLAAHYPAELKSPRPRTDPEAVWGGRAFAKSDDPQIAWMRALASRGWTAPAWPKAYGGGGLSRDEAKALEREIAAGGYRPPLLSFGLWMLGPVLLEYASEDQKQEHLPKIVGGEIRWCQGYSEPGAGSDLASLQTRCEDRGDHWLINGQKIWTSYANRADWCFCLVRTDTSKKHEGVSFILIDMASEGVETRPIKLISGDSPFCETFFTDVKVPKGNLVGQLNGGWEIAKRLLQYERQNISGGFVGGGGAAGGAAGDVVDIAKRQIGVDGEGRLADADLRGRITRSRMDSQAFFLTLSRIAAESRAANGPSAATSIIKYAAATLAQERSELIVEALGAAGLGWEGSEFTAAERQATRGWLRSKGNSIEGGTSEVNLNVVAKRVLGLPDPIKAS